ncbi:probable acyl-[acyl-carrier-protein]--UDP-N-acetylglucosamine O-acyltransferase, mitochondrial isoform X1 [Tanacetum coccineum]
MKYKVVRLLDLFISLSYHAGNECFLEVGDNNEIREHVSVHRSSKPYDRTDHAHTAGAIVVHQFCHIGSFCFIGGGSVVPWTNECTLENRELNVIIGAWFILWRD